jgi:hypothetical protein
VLPSIRTAVLILEVCWLGVATTSRDAPPKVMVPARLLQSHHNKRRAGPYPWWSCGGCSLRVHASLHQAASPLDKLTSTEYPGAAPAAPSSSSICMDAPWEAASVPVRTVATCKYKSYRTNAAIPGTLILVRHAYTLIAREQCCHFGPLLSVI